MKTTDSLLFNFSLALAAKEKRVRYHLYSCEPLFILVPER